MNDRIDAAHSPGISFDIEITNVIDLAAGEDLDKYGPFDISCAAAADDHDQVRHWTSPGPEGLPAPHLDASTAKNMLNWLREKQVAGARLFAWNGLSFDLRWLGVVAGEIPLAAKIALESYDPMFQFFVQRGFPVALGKVAEGFGIREGKLMDGADAPIEWARGNHQLVLDYVAGDCVLTNKVVACIEKTGRVRWRTQRGSLSSEPMPKLQRVRELLNKPEPDTSWMDAPIPRTKFTGWLPENRRP